MLECRFNKTMHHVIIISFGFIRPEGNTPLNGRVSLIGWFRVSRVSPNPRPILEATIRLRYGLRYEPKYILFIGIHTQLLCVTRGFGYHSPPTNAVVAGPSLEKPLIIE